MDDPAGLFQALSLSLLLGLQEGSRLRSGEAGCWATSPCCSLSRSSAGRR